MKPNSVQKGLKKKMRKGKGKADKTSIRRAVKEDLLLMEDMMFESDIRREINSVFEDTAYPQSSWQKIACLMERAELEEWLLDSKYLH